MKSLLNKVAVAASVMVLGVSSANAVALDNEIYLTGVVSEDTVVGFADVSGEAAAANRFVGVDLDLGSTLAGAAFAVSTSPIFVRTNSATGASMTVTDSAAAAGVLSGPGADIAVTYTLMGAPYVVDTTGAVSLVATTNAGSVTVGDFVATSAATGGAQVVGTYTATLNVTIAAN